MALQLQPPLPLPLPLPLSCCLLILTAITRGAGVQVLVKEGSDATLPCSLGTQDITRALFDWRKAPQTGQGLKEVFLYNVGLHYNNGLHGQSVEFRGRVAHFQDELQHGNASIVIRNTKMADGGNYSCAFPRLQTPQTFYVELVVDLPFKDRSGETSVATPKPFITSLAAGENWSLLQCEVRAASPKPEVSWQDGDGNRLPAEDPHVSETGSSYDITLNITVTKTGRYRCVVEQEHIKHSIASETFVHICEKVCEDPSSKVAVGWLAFTFVLGVVIVLAVQALLVSVKCITITLRNSPRQQGDDPDINLEKEKMMTNGVEHKGTDAIKKEASGEQLIQE